MSEMIYGIHAVQACWSANVSGSFILKGEKINV